MNEFIQAMQWRYAAKRMNGQRIPDETLSGILRACHLAPSSFGLQPYQVLVIDDPELKALCQPAIMNQPQVVESSHMLVFAPWRQFDESAVDLWIERVASERNMPLERLAGMANTIKQKVAGLGSDEARFQWAAQQAYLAAGVTLSAAAMAQVDATPMEGFDPQALDQVLNLAERNLRSTLVVCLGYRDEAEDWLAPMKKVRWPYHDVMRLLTQQDV